MLRGPSGVGQIAAGADCSIAGRCAVAEALLVADDRVELESRQRDLVMQAPPSIAGLIELRGRGIVSRPHVQGRRLHLVVDLVADMVRMVEEEDVLAPSWRASPAALPGAPTAASSMPATRCCWCARRCAALVRTRSRRRRGKKPLESAGPAEARLRGSCRLGHARLGNIA